MTCQQMERSMNPNCFANHLFVKGKIESLPKGLRTCSVCGREASLHVTWNKNPGMPIDKVAIIGCDRMVDEVFKRILLESALEGSMLSECFENKTS